MRLKDWSLPGIFLGLWLGQAPGLAEPVVQVPAPRAADSAFFIARSTNRNQVHYGVHVDGNCRPTGAQPVHAYWRMLEKGEAAVEPLLGREQPAYGLGDAQQVEATPTGWRVRVRLRAVSERVIDVDVFRENGRCAARAWMQMEGRPAQIERIFVKTAWPTGVAFVMLSGTGKDGRSLREVIRP